MSRDAYLPRGAGPRALCTSPPCLWDLRASRRDGSVFSANEELSPALVLVVETNHRLLRDAQGLRDRDACPLFL